MFRKIDLFVLVTISITAIVAILAIAITIEEKVSKRKPRPLPQHMRLKAQICSQGSLNAKNVKVIISNTCFPDMYLFVNPFNNNALMLTNTYPESFYYQPGDNAYRLNFNGFPIVQNQDSSLSVVMDPTKKPPPNPGNTWTYEVKTGQIVNSLNKKWTIIEQKDPNGFFVKQVVTIDYRDNDPIAKGWIISDFPSV